jgi:hypothetical protein
LYSQKATDATYATLGGHCRADNDCAAPAEAERAWRHRAMFCAALARLVVTTRQDRRLPILPDHHGVNYSH